MLHATVSSVPLDVAAAPALLRGELAHRADGEGLGCWGGAGGLRRCHDDWLVPDVCRNEQFKEAEEAHKLHDAVATQLPCSCHAVVMLLPCACHTDAMRELGGEAPAVLLP